MLVFGPPRFKSRPSLGPEPAPPRLEEQRGRVFILHLVSRMKTRPLCFSVSVNWAHGDITSIILKPYDLNLCFQAAYRESLFPGTVSQTERIRNSHVFRFCAKKTTLRQIENCLRPATFFLVVIVRKLNGVRTNYLDDCCVRRAVNEVTENLIILTDYFSNQSEIIYFAGCQRVPSCNFDPSLI